MKKIKFEVLFTKTNLHWVLVTIHRSRAQLRAALTKVGHKSHDTNACCWQANKPTVDNCIAEIHLAYDFLTVSTIIHECSHAAFHHAITLGVPKDHRDFQEWIANDTGNISDSIIAYLEMKRIPIRYESVSRTMSPIRPYENKKPRK